MGHGSMVHGTPDAGDGEDIAIVGMSCLFPGAETVAGFWRNVAGGVDCISDPPPDWRAERYCGPGSRASVPVYAGRGGYLGDLSRFNPSRYGVMPAGVEGAEPDQFLALRCSVEALADAGAPGVPLNREKTGVFLGRGLFFNRGQLTWTMQGFVVDEVVGLLRRLEPGRGEDELALIQAELKRNLPPFNAETVSGVAHCDLTGRIMNRLDLRGPAYTLDAACSSALVAVGHAVRELRSGHCDAVLAGGVQLSTPALVHQAFCQIDALSRAGRVAPFSADADGTLLGEGCGILVLKRRGDAERDGNRIYALVKAVSVSSDGRGAGLLAPQTEGQQLAIRRAYQESEIDPATVALIEAHGTGIGLGDETELHSLAACFGGPSARPRSVALGSVKSMIGHLLPASGAAALMKAALALYHRVIPPTLGGGSPHPTLAAGSSPFYLPDAARPWAHGGASPRRAGVNAFGFGGINAHAILEEPPAASELSLERLDGPWPVELVVVSAPDPDALRDRARALADWLGRAEGVRLLDVAAALAAEPGACRLAVVAGDVAGLVKKLAHAAKLLEQGGREKIQDRSGVFWYRAPLAASGRLAFVFPGEGAQYPDMLADLCRHFPEVRRAFDLTDRAVGRVWPGPPLSQLIFPPPPERAGAEARLLEMGGAVVSVTTAGRALLALLEYLGVTPDAVVGHSSGEFAALLAAGAFRPRDPEALADWVARGAEVAAKLSGSGLVPDAVLTAVGGVDRDAVEAALAASRGRVEVAMDNCPNQLILVGDEEATAAVRAALHGKGGLCDRLAWGRAYHTEAFAPACGLVEDFNRTMDLGAPAVELWSCATAGRYPDDPEGVASLALRQWSSKVRFRETVRAMYDAGVRVFLEVGPRGNLSAFVSDTLGKAPHAAVALDSERRGGLDQLCRALGMLAAHGVPVDLPALYRRRGPRPLDLAAAPPPPSARDPRLNQALPGLVVGDEVLARLRPPAPAAGSAADPGPGWPAGPSPAPAPQPALAFGAGTGSGYAEFQRTMHLFLEVQERAALDHFGAPAVAFAAPGGPPAPEVVASPAPAASAPPAPSVNGNGYHPPSPALTPPSVPARHDVPLIDRLRELVSQRTGYPVEMLEPGADLEADLGIDSIKRVEIVSAFRKVALPGSEKPPEGLMDRLSGAKTLWAIVERLGEFGGGAPPPGSDRFPFLGRPTVHEPGRRLVVESELDVHRHPFLLDHTFFGRGVSANDPALAPLPIMPLAMTLELMAEAASVLRPGLVLAAVSDARTMRWLAFTSDTRRVRLEAEGEPDGPVRVSAFEADRDGGDAVVASASFEFSDRPPDLGPPSVPDTAVTPWPWTQEAIYSEILYHGPAFRGVVAMEAIDAHGVRAVVKEPDPGLIAPGGGLVTPAALVDVVGQVTGIVVRRTWTDDEAHLTFPNRMDRLELGERPPPGTPLRAVTRVERRGDQVVSDVEMTTEGGRVVLRVAGRSEEFARLPSDLYRYWPSPRRRGLGRDLGGAFAHVPGAEHCAVCAAGNVAGPMLVNPLWAHVLARLTLSARERRAFQGLKLPPVPTASWLLGRVALKEAVRLLRPGDECLADVETDSEPNGRPMVVGGRGPAPLVSLAHKEWNAVAVAADPDRVAGVGIDLETVGPVDEGVAADAFTPAERTLIEGAAAAMGEPLNSWYLSAWGAKEAYGKALGHGLTGGPRGVEVLAIDPGAGRLTVAPRGGLLRACLDEGRAEAGLRAEAYRVVRGGSVVVLCVIPEGGSTPRATP